MSEGKYLKRVWVKVLIGVIVVAIIAGVVFFAIKNKNDNEMAMGEASEITVQKVKEEELSETILVTGEIVPEGEQKVFIDPEKGEIKEYFVKENQEVKAGDPLFAYDASKIQAEFNQAVRERKLVENRSKMERNQISELDKQIAEAKKNNEPKETINQLILEKQQLEIEHEGTKAEIESAQESINAVDKERKEMTVKSKIDGIVVKVDENVAKTESGSSEPAIHIISNKPFKVIGTMSEFDAVKIKPKQPVVIRPKVFKDREWKGVVESVSQFPGDGNSGGEEGEFYGGGGGNVTMYPFKVTITDDTAELRQGFHVSLEIKLDGDEKALAVPHSAILDEEGVEVIYVLKDNILERREVQTGSAGDEYIQIAEGVEKDELVVISPNEEMHDGMEVSSFVEVD